MILLLDIGNSTLHMGLARDAHSPCGLTPGLVHRASRIIWHQSIPATAQKFSMAHVRGAGRNDTITGAVIASVVPQLTTVFAEVVRTELGFEPLIVDHRTAIGMPLHYRPKATLGADRIANAAAARHLYPGNAIVADIGTATTLEVVTRDHGFVGGLIMPGLGLMLDSLRIGTGQLPNVELRIPRRILADSTRTGMLSGVFQAHFSGINAAIDGISRETKRSFRIVATGGLSKRFGRYINRINTIDPLLTLRGLSIIFALNDNR